MQWDPTPLNSQPGIVAPRLNIIPYDFQGLSGFPERHGITQGQLTDGNESPEFIAAILQSWLWYGLLSEFLLESLKPDEFTYFPEGKSSQPQLTLDPVIRLMDTATSCENLNEEEAMRRRSLLQETVQWLKIIENGPLHRIMQYPIAETTLSIRMLLYILGPLTGNADIYLDPHPLIATTLKSRGWCPSHIHRIEMWRNDVLGYYLACLRRPNPRGFNHSQCPKTNCTASSTTLSGDYVVRHTHKNTQGCNMLAVDDKSLRKIISAGHVPLVSIQKSTTSSELELHIRPGGAQDPFVAISHVWADGLGNPQSNALPECQVSRLSVYLANLPGPSFANNDDEPRTRYALGPFSIDLERKSLRYRSCKAPMSFWMDTLCIPVSTDPNDKETKELKKRAIDQMATIYGQATQVLVLDSALQELRIGAMQQTEILAQIIFSNWMGRSWTLQEGAISPYVYFQFADGALNFLDMHKPSHFNSFLRLHPSKFRLMSLGDDIWSVQWAIRQKWREKPPGSPRTAAETRSAFFYDFLYSKCLQSLHAKAHDSPLNFFAAPNFSLPKEDTVWVSRLTKVWNSLVVRTTTMEEDLPAIFANLLGVNTYEVLSLPSEKRLGAILGAGIMLPLSLLWNRGPRLGTDANHRGRWIPTLLGRHALVETPVMRLDSGHNLNFHSSDMILGLRPYFILYESKLSLSENTIFLQTPDGLRWHIAIDRKEDDSLDSGKYDYTGFVFRNRINGENLFEGCCLRLQPMSNKPGQFEALYDCVITVVSSDMARFKDFETRCSSEACDPIQKAQMLEEWDVTIPADSRVQYQLPLTSPRTIEKPFGSSFDSMYKNSIFATMGQIFEKKVIGGINDAHDRFMKRIGRPGF